VFIVFVRQDERGQAMKAKKIRRVAHIVGKCGELQLLKGSKVKLVDAALVLWVTEIKTKISLSSDGQFLSGAHARKCSQHFFEGVPQFKKGDER
jgi:hypothetical protein